MKNRGFLGVEGGRGDTGGKRSSVKMVMEAVWGAGRTAALPMHIWEEWLEEDKRDAGGGTRGIDQRSALQPPALLCAFGLM